MPKVLVVDDEESICWGLTRIGEELGCEVVALPSAEEALELIAKDRSFAVVVLDVRLPGMDGLAAIQHLRKELANVPIIVMTAYGDLDTAVRAVRNGAFEYLVKPFKAERIQQVLSRAIQNTSNELFAADVPAVEGFVGTTPAMQEVFNQIALAASADTSVLLLGESGTGKELAARAIHRYSSRAGGPFVAVNVAALSPALAESELFGHVRGAFTGADQARTGLLVKASGGTLFLDEVADIPRPTQVKLLRALEDGEVLPVGADEAVRTDLRVISATHRDLLQLTEDDSFRHDLYFRISAFQIALPALRERRDDIRALANYFAAQFRPESDTGAFHFSPEALAALENRPWHGNIRELRNAIEHATIVARNAPVNVEHLPPPMSAPRGEVSPDIEAEIAALLVRWATAAQEAPDGNGKIYERLLELVEPPVLRTIVDLQRGQVATSARVLGVHRTTLKKKLDQYELDGSDD